MNFRVALIKVGQSAGDPYRRGALQRTKRKQPLWFVARHHHSRLVHQGEDLLAIAQKAVSRRRQAQALVLADKQLNAEVGLQLADAGGEVGRHAMHFLRRLGNAAGAGDSVKHL